MGQAWEQDFLHWRSGQPARAQPANDVTVETSSAFWHEQVEQVWEQELTHAQRSLP